MLTCRNSPFGKIQSIRENFAMMVSFSVWVEKIHEKFKKQNELEEEAKISCGSCIRFYIKHVILVQTKRKFSDITTQNKFLPQISCRTLESFKASKLFWWNHLVVGNFRNFIKRHQRSGMDCNCISDIHNFNHTLPLWHSRTWTCIGWKV